VRHLPESQAEILNKPMRIAPNHIWRHALIALSPILIVGLVFVFWLNSTGWIQYSLGVLEQRSGRNDQAIDYFGWAIKCNPKWADAYDCRAQARTELAADGDPQNLELAIADASKAIELDPTKASYYETRAAAYEAADKIKEAIADYSHRLLMTPAPSNPSEEGGNSTESSAEGSWSPENRMIEARAELYEKLGDWKNADADRQKLIDQYTRQIEFMSKQEKNSAEKPLQDFLPYDDRAEQYEKIGEYKKALQDYTRAIECGPERSLGSTYATRADLEVRLNQDQAALKDYTKAIALAQSNSSQSDEERELLAANLYSRAKLYIKNKDYQNALSDCNTCLDLNPQDTYKACRAKVFDKLGQHEQANAERKGVIEPYDKAIKENSSDSNYNERGLAYEDLGLYNEALKDYLAAHQLDPKESSYSSNCAKMYGRLGNYEKAISMFTEAAQNDRLRTDKACYLAASAQDQFLVGRPQAAIDVTSQALQLDASNQDAYHWRSESEKMLGKFEAASNDGKLAARFEYDPDDD
jgi:tetratricopeptide (TPR) repeat protein